MAKKSRKAEKVAEEKPKETAIESAASLAGVLVTVLFILTFVVQSFASVVYRHGERLEESYVLHDRDNLSDESRNDFPMVAPSDDPNVSDSWRVELPSGVSLDSRYWGFVSRQNVIGRPMFVYWSFEASEDEDTRDSAAARTGSMVQVMLRFFDETRWQ